MVTGYLCPRGGCGVSQLTVSDPDPLSSPQTPVSAAEEPRRSRFKTSLRAVRTRVNSDFSTVLLSMFTIY